jgi:serine/threonine protein kinase
MAQSDSEREQIEVLASEFMERLRQGDAPSVAEYVEAHPDLAEEIRELFPTIAAAEQLKAWRTPAQGTARGTAGAGRAAGQAGGAAAVPAVVAGAGMTLGKYTLLERVGQGSLGTVWRSLHPDLGVPVAVKVLRSEWVGQSAAHVERFLREARTAAQLNHPHVVRVYDAGFAQGLYFLVMEFVEGGDVGELLRQAGGKLPIARAVAIITAVAQALQAAAELGIVHRDIKPDNILLDRKGTPKLADLGLARQLSDTEQPALTGGGQGLGTPLYIAPEQALGEGQPDARADIYSLGATFYHLVTGAPPFTGGTAYQIVHRHAHAPIVDPRERNPEISAALAGIIQRMLAKDPADRYPAAADLLADLARLEAGQAPAPWRPRQRERSRRWRVAAAALLGGCRRGRGGVAAAGRMAFRPRPA